MALLFYVRLIALTAGTLVYLFLLALILGHRRPRRFERLLFLLILSLFAHLCGRTTRDKCATFSTACRRRLRAVFSNLVMIGLDAVLVPLVVHAHVEYMPQVQQTRHTIIHVASRESLLPLMPCSSRLRNRGSLRTGWADGLRGRLSSS